MKFMIRCPVDVEEDGGAWLDPRNIAEFARAVEAAGIDALAFTDHPAPSQKWLEHGHATFDPFVALGFCAGVTSRLTMMTYLTVLPYRNPFLTAKAMATVDVLAGGRSIFVLGVGYVRSEFNALGVDFDERNELFDEAVDVVRGVLSADNFAFKGRHFEASGQTITPAPVQRPHPPLWLGGNAPIVLERVAQWGQGWAPLGGSPQIARAVRTRYVGLGAELDASISQLSDLLEGHGRSLADIDICVHGISTDLRDAPAEAALEEIERRDRSAITWTALTIPTDSFSRALDVLAEFGDEVVAKSRT